MVYKGKLIEKQNTAEYLYPAYLDILTENNIMAVSP